MNKRLVVSFSLIFVFSSLCSIASASNPIPPGIQADSGSITDFSGVTIYGKKWEDVSSGELLRLYYMKLGQEQLQGSGTIPANTSGTTPVTTVTDPVNTSGSTMM